VPLKLTTRKVIRPPRRRQDAVLQSSGLGISRVETMQLLLHLSQFILQVQQYAMIQRLEAAVHRLYRR